MTNFDKMCEALGIELPEDVKEDILLGNEALVLFWNEDGSLRDWGTL